ncbi:MAG: sporulation integral membrane protein YtvI [Clostridia bacterium]|nr:sporulation integral membrane protein YtvI [Clostridia bacterium]
MHLWERLKDWNLRMNGLPRKLALVAAVLAACYLLIALFPLCWPFVLALCFALLMEPLVRLLRQALAKCRLGNTLATLTGMLAVFGLIGYVSIAAVSRLARELLDLARSMPQLIVDFSGTVTAWLSQLYTNFAYMLPENFMALADSALNQAGKELMGFATSLSAAIASGAFDTAVSLPAALLTVVLTVMATYYLSADRQRILSFLNRTFPESVCQWALRMKNGIFKALFGQIKSQALVSLLITLTVLAGLLLQNKPYWLLIGLIIGVADALPIVGAGLFLIPWALFGFVTGDMTTGIGMALLYVATILVRQIFEPRIVGKNLGLYPLATMMAIFAGYQLMGFIGMLAGPVILNICRVVLEADREAKQNQ